MREIFRVPFSRAVPWYGLSAAQQQQQQLSSLKPFDHQNNNNIATTDDDDDDDAFLLGCLQHNNNNTDDACSNTTHNNNNNCVLYLHGFPDQAVDHRQELPEVYGQFSTRMSKKLAEAMNDSSSSFAAINFSGSPGSDGGLSFRNKTVSQEVWDVLNTMSYLSSRKEEEQQQQRPIIDGFHLVGLSTGAIIGAVLRGLSDDIREALGVPPILSITIIAACGCNGIEKALSFDFDEKQRSDFDTQGHCTKKFWLPIGSVSNPKDATTTTTTTTTTTRIIQVDNEEELATTTTTPAVVEQSQETKWCPHDLKLDVRYQQDFLQLPIQKHLQSSNNNNNIPLLCIHGGMDTNIPMEEGKAVFAAAVEPKKFVEIPKGNHLLTNSKHLKKAITEIKKWHQGGM